MGHEIELTLDWNSGIDHNAAILYQGLTIGKIESFSKIDPVTRKITATAKVNPRVVPYLTEKSQFYIVAPRIDLTGVSNAKNLLTGTYISMRASLDGEVSSHFKVFSTKPPYQYTEPGLHLALDANDRSSLQIGSNVYYKQQLVGNVQAIDTITPEQHLVYLHIQPEFTHYVNQHSRFYNSSGIKIKANLQGVDIQAQSLQSMLTGSVTFSSQDDEAEDTSSVINNGDSFLLYPNEKLAKQKTHFTLHTKLSTQVTNNTRVLYRGVEVGSIHRIDNMDGHKQLQVGLLPEYHYILTEQSQFWLVKPSLSLSGASDTDALLGGAYITFTAGQGNEKTSFDLLTSPPAKHASAAGLQLTLLSDHAQVATPGSAVSYRGVTIGQVDNVSLDKAEDNIRVSITIDEEHRQLVQHNSRFYNASGLTIRGGISNFTVKTESVDAILRGGISFYNPESYEADKNNANELDSFKLFAQVEEAENAGLAISIHFNDSSGLKSNSKVIYQEQEIGIIERLVFQENKVGVTALVLLNDSGAQYANKGTKFWKIEPQIGLVGSKNVGALLDGAFITLLPSTSENKSPQTKFTALTLAPTVEKLPYGLNVKLNANRLGSVRVGNPILYRQIRVGKVIGVGLSDTADTVNIFINIAENYAPLINSGTQFWNTSGINIEAGVFSGINIDSESIETLVAGGIAFATPELDEPATLLPEQFILHQDLDTDWLEWQPKIKINP
jgi:paraquat-inducible protein B